MQKHAKPWQKAYRTVISRFPFRYRGYYFDRETGFYYLQSRYYDPATGRFLNADVPGSDRNKVKSIEYALGMFGNSGERYLGKTIPQAFSSLVGGILNIGGTLRT